MADIATHGFVLVRGVVAREDSDTLRALIDDAVAQRAPGVDLRAGTVWIRDARSLGPAVEQLATVRAVLDATAALLGPGPVPTGSVMRNPVGLPVQQALHVDWAGPIAPGEDQQAQAMFLLDDVADDNGPTRLVPDTHRSGQVTVTASAGDVLVFSSHLWHSGTANLSGRPRRVLTVTYQRGG